MIFREIIPCEALRSLVDNILFVNFDLKSGDGPVKPYPARIEQALVFFVRGRIVSFDPGMNLDIPIPPTALFGQQVSRLDFRTYANSNFLMLMVIFKPGALFRLLGIPAAELTCRFTDAESIIAAELRYVNDQLANATSYREMITCLEQYLLKKSRRVSGELHAVDKIAQVILSKPNSFSLERLADQANLSPRQFQRKFKERIGVGPKLFSRIDRFSRAFFYKEQHPDIDWLSIAVQFGYTDYYHLVKDFKQFAHATPNVIMDEYSRRPEVVLKDDPTKTQYFAVHREHGLTQNGVMFLLNS